MLESSEAGSAVAPVLLTRVNELACAIPISSVIETMRSRPVTALSEMPRFVAGVAIIRGEPVAVLDLGVLLGATEPGPRAGWFVTVRVGKRVAALALAQVMGIRWFSQSILFELPPLLRSAHPELIASLGSLDQALLVVLDGSRVVSQELLERIAEAR